MGKKQHGRPSVSTDRFATALLIEDSGEHLTYDDVMEIESTLITTKYQPKMNSASQASTQSDRVAEASAASPVRVISRPTLG